MAITAKFFADFSDFKAAVDAADVKLKSFETDAHKVEGALQRMTDSFSGRRVIQEATLIAKAIEQVGGVSALTAKELERAGAATADATAKMIAMGQTVPPEFQKITQAAKDSAAQIKKAADEAKSGDAATTDGFGGLLKNLGGISGVMGTLGISVGVGSLIAFTKSAMDAADQLSNLSAKTGISTDDLQTLQLAADDSGNSLDEVASAVAKMQKNIVTGNKESAAAIGELGLSIENLRGLSPAEQFMQIGDKLALIEDPAERATAAIAIFGKSGANVLPTLTHGFDEVRDAGVKMSADTVRALDDLGDALTRVSRSATAFGANILGALVSQSQGGFAYKIIRDAQDLQTELGKLTDRAKDAAPAMAGVVPPGLPNDVKNEKDIIAELNKKLEENKEAARKAADEQKRVVAQMKLIEGTTAAFKIGSLAEQLQSMGKAIALDVSPGFLKVLDTLKKVETEAPLTGAALAGIGKQVPPEISKPFLDVLAALEKVETKAPSVGTAIQQVGLVSKPSMDDLKGRIVDWEGGLRGVAEAFARLGQTAGGDLGSVAQTIGTVVGSLDLGVTAGKGLDTAFTNIGKGGTAAAGGVMQLATALPSMIAALDQASQSGGVLGGALSGAAMGMQFGPWGAAIGAGAGALYAWASAADDAYESNVRMLEQLQRSAGGFNEWSKRVELAGENLSLLNPEYEEFEFLAKRATKAMNEQGEAMVKAFKLATDESVLFDRQMMQTIVRAQELGAYTAQLGDLFGKLGKNAVEGLNKTIAGADMTSASMNDLVNETLAVFNAATLSGMSFDDALKAIHPSIEALRKGFEDLGVNTDNAALRSLFLADAISSNNPKLIAALDGLVESSSALYNMGLLNADTFTQMERTGFQMYQNLQAAAAAAGGSTEDALLPMQGWLHKAAEEAARLGIPLDDNTQMLIDQSHQLGIWQDVGETANDALLHGMEQLVESMKELIDKLGQLPGQMSSAANAGVAGFNAIADAATRAKEAVDTVSFGSSPGGIKEIPLQFRKATDASRRFSDAAVRDADRVGNALDDLTRTMGEHRPGDPDWWMFDTGPESEAKRRRILAGLPPMDVSPDRFRSARVTSAGSSALVINLDGRQLTRLLLPSIPRELKLKGLA